ncbi:hypothetical protein DPEC_G00161780 [Dallia pectoralis]|uniref:Uncharacterized protein n=1 Tax=Dallia pectoralis TaxID=75939 RepID=A0ACC2GGN7_DALPE|nr:hypothetical protein DPEC_G00161780 [Dallia pectoralis]
MHALPPSTTYPGVLVLYELLISVLQLFSQASLETPSRSVQGSCRHLLLSQLLCTRRDPPALCLCLSYTHPALIQNASPHLTGPQQGLHAIWPHLHIESLAANETLQGELSFNVSVSSEPAP